MANDYVFKESEKVARESLKSVFKPKGDITDLIDSVELSSSAITSSIDIQNPVMSTLTEDPTMESSSISLSGRIFSSSISKTDESNNGDHLISPSDQLLFASQGHAKRRPSQSFAALPHTISSQEPVASSGSIGASEAAEETSVEREAKPTFTKSKATIPIPQAPKQVDSLEDLLAKMDATSQNYSALHSASVLENGMESYPANTMDNGVGSADFGDDDGKPPDGEVIWKGTVKMPIEGQFGGRAIQVYGPLVPKSIWPNLCRSSSELLITGRILSTASTKYIYERLSKKSDIIVVEILPDSTPAASAGFQKLVSYFSTKDRWAVIEKPKGKSFVKDFYLVPVPAGRQLLGFFSDLEGPLVPLSLESKRDRFFGVFILATGTLNAPPPPSQPSLPYTVSYSDPRLESVSTYQSGISGSGPPPTSSLPTFIPDNPSTHFFPVNTPPSSTFPFLNQYNLPSASLINTNQAMLHPTLSQLMGQFGNGGGGMQVSSSALNDLLKNLNQAKQ